MKWTKIQDFQVSQDLDYEGYHLTKWISPLYVKDREGRWIADEKEKRSFSFDYAFRRNSDPYPFQWSKLIRLSFSIAPTNFAKDLNLSTQRTRPMYLSHIDGTCCGEERDESFLSMNRKEEIKNIPEKLMYMKAYMISHVEMIKESQKINHPQLFPEKRKQVVNIEQGSSKKTK